MNDFSREHRGEGFSGWFKAAKQFYIEHRLLIGLSLFLYAAPIAFLFRRQFTFGEFKIAQYLFLIPIAVFAIKQGITQIRSGAARLYLRSLTFLAPLAILLYAWNPFATYAIANAEVANSVFFCTDRTREQMDLPSSTKIYGGYSPENICREGLPPVCATAVFGIAKVYLPIHKNARAPLDTVLVSNPHEDPEIDFLSSPHFFGRLADAVHASRDRDALLFVHGFRNSFEESLTDVANISTTLKFKGAAIVYSWPAHHEFGAWIEQNYGGDSRRVPIGANDLAILLPEIRDRSNADRFHVIAHSIGSTLTAQAIFEAGNELCRSPKPFDNVIFAAPDLYPELLNQQGSSILCSARRFTVYYSRTDSALRGSSFLQEGERVGAGTAPIPGADFIDATNVDTDFFGHSYIFESPVLRDVSNLLHQSPDDRADERIDINKDSRTGAYVLSK